MKQLKTYVLILSILAMVATTTVVLTIVGVEHFQAKSNWEKNRGDLVTQFSEDVEKRAFTVLRLFFDLGQKINNELYAKAKEQMFLLEHIFHKRYKFVELSETETNQVEIINQYSRLFEKTKVPILNVGVDTATQPFKSGIIQDWGRNIDANGSILQRINVVGDMLRVDSNLIFDKVLAKNYYLPSKTQQDATASLVKNLLENKSFWGPVRFTQYILFGLYKPLMGVDNKKCVGAFEVAFLEDLVLKSLTNLILKPLEKEGISVALLHTKDEFLKGENLLKRKGVNENSLMLIPDAPQWRALIEAIMSDLTDSTMRTSQTEAFECIRTEFVEKGLADSDDKAYAIRAAYFKPFDWLLVLACDQAKTYAKIALLEDHIKRGQFSFHRTFFYALIGVFIMGFLFFKIADKRLNYMQNHLMRLREILGKIRDQRLNFDFYSGLNNEQYVLADLLKDGREMAICVKKYISEESNISKDIHHNLDNLITNFELAKKINEQLMHGHINVTAGFESVYSRMKKAEDSATLLTKAVKENKNLHSCLDQKIQSLEVMRGQEQQHISKTMSEIVETMSALSALQKAIKTIANTKDGLLKLSEQTNLLSLNATIEASVSGVNGKGFAVVAEEVKDLSRKTTQSTNAIDKEVENMKKVTDLVIEKIRNIQVLNQESENIFSQLQSASSEQNTEINTWMSQVEQWTATLTPLVQTIQEFTTTVETLYKDLEKMNSGFERNRQYVSAFQNDIESLQRNFDELQRLLVSWEFE